MRRPLLAACAVALCAACQNSVSVQRDAEVVSSTAYDHIDCDALARQRDALAAQHGLAADATRAPQQESNMTGFGILIPDSRSSAERATARAIGEITAMNQSMERRRCGRA